MALYVFAKTRSLKLKWLVSVISVICIFSGMSLLAWALYPIISFELFYAPRFGSLVKPIASEEIKNTIAQGFPQVLGTEDIDYTRASVWFPKARSLKLDITTSSYWLSIPKLRIEKAAVVLGAEDLTKSLIHFTGPLPGNLGNPVIFGHSTLIWFYNPTDYRTIFSKLPELKIDDPIFITIDNITYQYKIYEMKIVTPEDLSVLEQNYDGAYITLITCVPPGTYFKRLAVLGKLVNI
jgi:sortase A